MFVEKEYRPEYWTEREEKIEIAVYIDAGFPEGRIVDWKSGRREEYSKIQSGIYSMC